MGQENGSSEVSLMPLPMSPCIGRVFWVDSRRSHGPLEVEEVKRVKSRRSDKHVCAGARARTDRRWCQPASRRRGMHTQRDTAQRRRGMRGWHAGRRGRASSTFRSAEEVGNQGRMLCGTSYVTGLEQVGPERLKGDGRSPGTWGRGAEVSA